MAKKQSGTARGYLKIIGIVSMVLGILGIICGILLACGAVKDLNSFGDLSSLRNNGMSDEQIRISLGIGSIIASTISAWAGWVIYRASRKNGKTTLALVLTVLNLVSNFVSVVSNTPVDQKISYSISLVIYVLAFMALLRVRRENEDE